MEMGETAVYIWGSSFGVDESRAKELSDTFALVDPKKDGTSLGRLLTENLKERGQSVIRNIEQDS